MRYVLCLFLIVTLVAVLGCVASRPPAARARLLVESAASRDLSPSSTASALKADNQVAIAKVISRAQNPRFQRQVAEELGVSPATVSGVVAQDVAETGLVEVRAEIADPVLAARVVNAVANRLARDFSGEPDIQVRVLDTASPPRAEQ